MGRAIVYTHLGNGLYNIGYIRENTRAKARVTKLQAIMVALDEQLSNGETGLMRAEDVAQGVYNIADARFHAALTDWADCASQLPPCAEKEALLSNVRDIGQQRAEAGVALNGIKAAIAENRAEYFAAQNEIAYLQNTAKTNIDAQTMQVWCVDYDPDAIIEPSTEVGTIETYGAKGAIRGGWLPKPHINIQTSADPDYDVSRDHCIQPISNRSAATAAWHYMQWPYVMANNPQYAVGKVLSKFSPDQDWLDVTLYGSTPSALSPAGYPFVKGENSITLINLPVDYLTCGAKAFVEGDDVVVRFSGLGRANPVVIGFAEQPRPCEECRAGLVKNGQIGSGEVAELWPQPVGGSTFANMLPSGKTALLSGNERRVCKEHFGLAKWIYTDPDGIAWMLDSSGLVLDSSSEWNWHLPLAAEIEIVRYQSAETHTINVSLPDWQQVNAPAIPYSWNNSYLYFDVEDITSGRLELIDITPDGSRAVFAAYSRGADWAITKNQAAIQSDDATNYIKRALGFYELVIQKTLSEETGDPVYTATLSIVANRATTLGTVATTPGIQRSTQYHVACELPDDDDYWVIKSIVSRSGSSSTTIQDRIIGYRYLPTGALDPTLLSISQSETVLSDDHSGGTSTSAVAITLQHAGQSITHVSTTAFSLAQSITINCGNKTWSLSGTSTTTASSDTLDEISTQQQSYPITNAALPGGGYSLGEKNQGIPESTVITETPYAPTVLDQYSVAGIATSLVAMVAIWNYSNNLIGFAQLSSYLPTPEIYTLPAAYAGLGNNGSTLAKIDGSAPQTLPLWRGSHDPINGDITIGETTPVCYVRGGPFPIWTAPQPE